MLQSDNGFGLYTTFPCTHSGGGELGIRTYHVPFPTRTVLLVHGFGRSSNEPKFRALCEELAYRNVASATIDLNIKGRQKNLLYEEMLWDIECAESHLAREHGLYVSAYAGHSLGATLAIARVIARTRREAHFNLRSLALIAPALNQAGLLRYWFFRKYTPRATWQRFIEEWRARPHLERAFLHENDRPVYAENILDMNLSFESSRYLRKTLRIHGRSDEIVPIESIPLRYRHELYVPHGDHDLDTDEALDIWITRTARHLAADHVEKRFAPWPP